MADQRMNVEDSTRDGVDPGQIDLVNRDPNDLNGDLHVLFEDMIGEPDGAHSADCVWSCAFKVFTGSKKICYLLLTTICAVPMALFWGCTIACVTFNHIWHVTPCYKIMQINLLCCQRFISLFINTFMAPCVEVNALIFSKIHVKVENI
ncbi:caveolin-3-like [Watersipora subatra]|uniref:caveolin-3-like n=1 Tax=Watersipora subatra TaxID=2589382 RepID=UPI00355C1B99